MRPTLRSLRPAWPVRLAPAVLLALASVAGAAAPPPVLVLRAHARQLDIRDGNRRWPGVWTADPSASPDVYLAQRSDARRVVTFYSDLDSLAIEIAPGERHDFVVLLDDSIACRTQVSAVRTGPRRTSPGAAGSPVEIPFTIGGDGKPSLEGRVNGSRPLRLLFDTGAATTVLYPSAVRKGVTVVYDGTASNAGTGGTVVRRTSSDNTLEIGGLSWSHEPVLEVGRQADREDGIVGIDLFADKVVELDFGRGVLVVRDSLPPLGAGFERFELGWRGTLPLLRATLRAGGPPAEGAFVINTGSAGAVSVNQDFAARHGLPGNLRKHGSVRVGGVGPRTARADRVRLPVLTIGSFKLRDVPMLVERPSRAGAQFGDMLGVQVLRRFDVLLDFHQDAVHLRPTPAAREPFPGPTGPFPTILAASLAGAAAAALGILLARTRARASRPAPRA